MLRRPDRVPRFGRARGDRSRTFRTRRPGDRFLVLRWVIVAVWAVLVGVRITVAVLDPHTDLAVFGLVEIGAIVVGVAVVLLGVRHAWVSRRRHEDEALGLAVKRVDPTVWLVPATPTQELRDAVAEAKPEIVLGDRVTWAFGATEASLWELDDRKATRVLVVRWSRMMHVGIEDVPHGGRRSDPRERRADRDAHSGRRRGAGAGAGTGRDVRGAGRSVRPSRRSRGVRSAIALHYVRADDRTAVATFFVRKAPGSLAVLGRGPRLERLVMDLAAERIVA